MNRIHAPTTLAAPITLVVAVTVASIALAYSAGYATGQRDAADRYEPEMSRLQSRAYAAGVRDTERLEAARDR